MEDRDRLEQIALAIEDLIYMGAINLDDKSNATISRDMSAILSNLTADDRVSSLPKGERIMNLMYYGLLIFMNERLRLPKAFTLALGNDLESHREDMKTGELMSTYVQILAEISSKSFKSLNSSNDQV